MHNNEITTIINNFHLIRPGYLWLFLAFFIIFLIKFLLKILKKNQQNKLSDTSSWAQVCNKSILSTLYINNTQLNKNFNFLTFLIGTIFIIALSGPSWIKKDIPVYKNKNSWIIILSLAESMQKTDVTPSRLQRAKYKINDFLNYLHDDQLALIVYNKNAFDLIPLTNDKKTIAHILPSIDPLIMPTQGDNVDTGLARALKITSNLKLKKSSIILLTDSDANSQSLLVSKKLGDSQVPINIINFNKSSNKSADSLKELALLSKGSYQQLTNDDGDIKQIITHSKNTYKQYYEQDQNITETEVWYDMGPWVLLFTLPFILLYFSKSRNSISILFFLIIILAPGSNQLYAKNNLFSALWYNKQQINSQQIKTDHDKANNIDPNIFTNKNWKAIAAYNKQDYHNSEILLSNSHDPINLYNYANALAKQGKISEAIANYEKVLQLDPNNKDASFNKSLLEKYQDSKKTNDSQKKSPKKTRQDSSDNKDNQNTQNKSEQSQQNERQSDRNKQSDQKNSKQSSNQLANKSKNNHNSNPTPEQTAENNSFSDNKQPGQQQNTQNQLVKEQKQKDTKKWLDKIPDNPAIYLRNQLQYEYWNEQQNKE